MTISWELLFSSINGVIRKIRRVTKSIYFMLYLHPTSVKYVLVLWEQALCFWIIVVLDWFTIRYSENICTGKYIYCLPPRLPASLRYFRRLLVNVYQTNFLFLKQTFNSIHKFCAQALSLISPQTFNAYLDNLLTTRPSPCTATCL